MDSFTKPQSGLAAYCQTLYVIRHYTRDVCFKTAASTPLP